MAAEAPSIARRLLLVTGLGSLLMALAITAATVLAVEEEVDELLDDTLQAAAVQLAPLLVDNQGAVAVPDGDEVRFAWAWYDSAHRLVRASRGADPEWLQRPPKPGLASTAHWRLYDLALGRQQGVLRVAQTRAERSEVRAEVVEFALLAAFGLMLFSLPLLAWRAQQELRPLERLAQRLAAFDATRADPRQLAEQLGPARRSELEPVHRALEGISQRLGERLAFEREFSAQAAHLLRTPLAGMEAQLAVAMKEHPEQARLLRVREANQRLQALVVALLRLFRSEPTLKRSALDARELLAGLPRGGLQLDDGPPCPLQADAELLAAALLNLIDNAQRHGATRLRLTQPAPQTLRLHDDGRGMHAEQRARLEESLRGGLSTAGQAEGGLGLRLALLVAQAHGGSLALPASETGFDIELTL